MFLYQFHLILSLEKFFVFVQSVDYDNDDQTCDCTNISIAEIPEMESEDKTTYGVVSSSLSILMGRTKPI